MFRSPYVLLSACLQQLQEKDLPLRHYHELNLGIEFVDHRLLDEEWRKGCSEILVSKPFLRRARQFGFALPPSQLRLFAVP
jgi:hypothetical protein